MKPTAISLIALCLLCPICPAEPSAADAKRQAIRNLLEVQGASKNATRMLDMMIASLKRSNPNVDAKFWVAFRKKIDPNDLIELIIPIYEKHFTVEDIHQVTAFYKSPVGRKFVSLQPQIMQESIAAGQRWGAQIAQQVMQELQQQQ